MTVDKDILVVIGSAHVENRSREVFVVGSSDAMSNAQKDVALCSLLHVDLVIGATEVKKLYNPLHLSGWSKFLLPNASISVRVMGESSGKTLKPIHTSFLLAGLSGTSERREADGSRVLTVTRKPMKVKVMPISIAQKNNRIVTISMDDDLDMDDDLEDMDDADLIDEDGLLELDDLLKPPPAMQPSSAVDDCGGRKACDDCTCGRAEKEAGASPKKSSRQKVAPKSNCGSCSMGDAFRCAGCPFLGLPAFKPGEENLVLQLADDL